ncbi:MAG: hypothetical protein LQ344_001445 [Seirophora lacunosa]|nr:MAG: hypothetical protein LQ344_001445 [Seirophora lacunosa]
MAVVIAHFLGSILSSLFQCTPTDKYWHREKPGYCVNGDTVILIPGAVNVVLDFLILALPIPLLWKLRTTVPQKSLLTGVFICAGFLRPLAALIARGTHRVRSKSVDAVTSSSSNTSSKAIWKKRKGSGDRHHGEGGHFLRIGDPFARQHPTRWARHVSVRGGKDVERGSAGDGSVVGGDDTSLQEMNVPEGQIKIKEEIVITRSDWLEYNDRVY